MPVAVFIALPGGQPYYVNEEAERVLGQGVVRTSAPPSSPETYNAFQSGTDQPYPTEQMAIVRATRGVASHADDMEIRKPDSAVIPLEVWGARYTGQAGTSTTPSPRSPTCPNASQAADHSQPGRAARTGPRRDLRPGPGRPHHVLERRRRAHLRLYPRRGDGAAYPTTCSAPSSPSRWPASRPPRPSSGLWEGELVHRAPTADHRRGEPLGGTARARTDPCWAIMEINRDITARKDAEREALRVAERSAP